MKDFAIALFILASLTRSDSSCPENVVCTSTLRPNQCPEGYYYREKVKSNNCCPGCVKLKDYGQKCQNDEDCAPGLYCPLGLDDHNVKRCSHDPSQKCEYYKRTDENWIITKYWEPNCLPNGDYAEKQCKGEKLSGKCFCTNEHGKRVFGENSWMEATNMTCACSRLVEKLRRTRKDVSLHCDEDGNFEPLQCDNGICWCANERTGVPYTPIVPEMMTRVLPCFEEKNFGSQYLRKCDSVHVQTEKAIRLLKNHGLTTIVLPTVNCNYDGSYARVQFQGSRRYCAYRNKKALCSPAATIQDCNCMYDQFVAKINKKDFHFECDDRGSYKEIQDQGNMKFKVDADGCPYQFDMATG